MIVRLILILIYSVVSDYQKDMVCNIVSSMDGIPKEWNCANVSNMCSWNMFKCNTGGMIYTANLYSTYGSNISCKNCMKYFFKLPMLSYFYVGGNITDSIDSMYSATKLVHFEANDVNLYGTIPTEIGTFMGLSYLKIYKTMVSGTIPRQINSINRLDTLILSFNRLTGSIPKIHKTSIKYLDLSYNELSGLIDIDSMYSTSGLTYIDISRNRISGSLPIALPGKSNIYKFIAYSNRLSGYVPLISNSILYIIDLSNNRYSGNDTSSIDYYTNQPRYVDLSGNRYTMIPTWVFTGATNIKRTPQDFDECLTGRYVCGNNSYCSDGWNPYMSYTCGCLGGYIMTNNTCIDIDECSNGEWSYKNSSNTNSSCKKIDMCINTGGGFLCCIDGYIRSSNGSICVDVDECNVGLWNRPSPDGGPGNCKSVDVCINHIGGFMCCDNGYVRSSNGTVCVDIDECSLGTHNCTSKDACINTIGSWKCCDRGYRNVMEVCVDIDECIDPHICPIPGTCVNTNGSYFCCNYGYKNILGVCIDIDECISSSLNTCTDSRACINTNGSYFCCKNGYIKGENGECIDLNECMDSILNPICGRFDGCQNTIGGYMCCNEDEYNTNPESGVCTDCYADYEYIVGNNTYKALSNYIPQHNHIGYMTCLGECNNGVRISIRKSYSSSCKQDVIVQERCDRPCIGLTEMNSVESSLYSLVYELSKENFLVDIIYDIFNSNVTIIHNMNKRSYSESKIIFLLNKCDRMNDVMKLIKELTVEITPSIPNPKYEFGIGCSIQLSSHSSNSTFMVMFSLIGIIPIVIITIFSIIIYHRLTNLINHLPNEVAWSYRLYSDKLIPTKFDGWKYIGGEETGFHYKEFKRGSDEYNRTLEYILDRDMLKDSIKSITLIYNKTLLDNFIGSYLIQSERMKKGGLLFYDKKWCKNKDANIHEFVYNIWEKLNLSYSWNKNAPSIIPVCHGTDRIVAEKICETGFANLSSLDQGWYGKGIYFSSYSLYCSPYFSTKRKPAIILAWILPGNIYPVIEKHDSNDTLIGTAIKSGYKSHYVIVDKKGRSLNMTDFENIVENINVYNEIVIEQESQIVPMAIIDIEVNKIDNLISSWLGKSLHG